MTCKFFLPFLSCLLISVNTFSQDSKYFEKGYIITNNGDTTSGYLEKLTDVNLSKKVKFKKNADAGSIIQTWYPNDILGFYFEKDELKFERVEFSVRMGDTLLNDKRFAVLLLTGYCNLYRLDVAERLANVIFESNSAIVYVVKKEGTWYTLSKTEAMTGNQYVLSKEYIQVVKDVTADCASINQEKINNLLLFDKAIMKVVNEYNQCRQPQIISEVHRTKTPMRIIHGINGGYTIYRDKDISGDKGFSFGYFIDLHSPSVSLKGTLTTGINYLYHKYSNESYSALRFPVLATYRFSEGNVVPFFNIGFVPYYYFTGNKNLTFYISAGAGCYINKRVMLSVLADNVPGLVAGGKEKYFNFTAGIIL